MLFETWSLWLYIPGSKFKLFVFYALGESGAAEEEGEVFVLHYSLRSWMEPLKLIRCLIKKKLIFFSGFNERSLFRYMLLCSIEILLSFNFRIVAPPNWDYNINFCTLSLLFQVFFQTAGLHFPHFYWYLPLNWPVLCPWPSIFSFSLHPHSKWERDNNVGMRWKMHVCVILSGTDSSSQLHSWKRREKALERH